MKEKNLYVGTSGYAYSHWENGVFYPENLAKSKKLEYYSQHFKTVELNSTFYRLPGEKVFESWYKKTPKDFVFSVKASKFITHTKKLEDFEEFWETFLERVLILKEKLGPILFQLPPGLKKDSKKLKNFLKTITHSIPQTLRFAFEFRNKSWCENQIYKILQKYNCAWVIADSPSWPKVFKVTADFVYVRMHGSKVLFTSNYSHKELKDLGQKIKRWLKSYDVYVYFNNDAKGYAIENAKELLELLS